MAALSPDVVNVIMSVNNNALIDRPKKEYCIAEYARVNLPCRKSEEETENMEIINGEIKPGVKTGNFSGLYILF